MQTRSSSSVLGKRGHRERATSTVSTVSSKSEQLQTPDSTPHPKRPRTSLLNVGDDSNKENIPPLSEVPSSPRSARSLHRTASAVVTPTRARRVQRTYSSISIASTPTREAAEPTMVTPPPTPPAALQPIHVQARALLRSTCNNVHNTIAGRDAERAIILAFVAAFSSDAVMDQDTVPTSLFISGAPGTGKTALVNEVLRDVGSDVKVVSINCMALKSVDALWERIHEEFGDRKPAGKRSKAKDTLVDSLCALQLKTILMLDELDHITPTPQALEKIFALSGKCPSTLRIVGIANTHTLTAFTSALDSSVSVKTVHFAPYTPAQLHAILKSRLASLSDDVQVQSRLSKLLPNPSLILLTKKVAALTGDVRSLFEVLRGAIDLAVASSESAGSDGNPLDTRSPSVTPPHILSALKAYTPSSTGSSKATSFGSPSKGSATSETISKVSSLGLQARLALLTILLASGRVKAGLPLTSTSSPSTPKKASPSPIKRTQSAPQPSKAVVVGVETGTLFSYYSAVLSRVEHGLFDAVSSSEFGDVLGVLEGVGLVTLSSTSALVTPMSSPSKGRRGFNRTASIGAGLGKGGAGAVGEVRLVEGVWADEILRGLGISEEVVVSTEDAREEEVRGIWLRERAKIQRDIKANLASTTNHDVFEGAFED